VVQAQRNATMRTLQEYTRLKASTDQTERPDDLERPSDLSWRLVLDAMLFQAEAEIRWLDHCEASLLHHPPPPTPPTSPPTASPPTRSAEEEAERQAGQRADQEVGQVGQAGRGVGGEVQR
jgi:hypothetical protein